MPRGLEEIPIKENGSPFSRFRPIALAGLDPAARE
jgi:hypothetical protein